MSTANFETFMRLYAKHLEACVTESPEDYVWTREGKDALPRVLAKMGEAILKGSYNKDSKAIKRTCKELGIKYTYAGINAYVKGETL